MAFPNSPTDEQVYKDYFFDSAIQAWKNLDFKEIPTNGLIGLWNGHDIYPNGRDRSVNIGFKLDDDPNITLSAWAYPTSIPDWSGIVSNKPSSGPEQGINLQIGTQNRIAALIGEGSSGSYSYLKSSTAPQVNQWYFISLTIKSNIAKIYINGVYENQESYSSISMPDSFRLGDFYDVDDLPFYGYIGEVILYNRDLTDEEISTLYEKSSINLYFLSK